MGTYKEIHIGKLLESSVRNQNIEMIKIQNYFNFSKSRIYSTFKKDDISIIELLKWCKLLRIDFFRIYSGHLMLHHGISSKPSITNKDNNEEIKIRKNMYTIEIKKFIVSQIRLKEISASEAIVKYSIPKTTLYKWLHQI